LWRLASPAYYRSTASMRTGYEALRLIPANASVIAQGPAVPHLSERSRIYMLLGPLVPDADFLVASEGLSPWPAADYAAIAMQVDERKQRGYETVLEKDGWIVLRRR